MQLWDDETDSRLMLLTPDEFGGIPDGTVLTSISGTCKVKEPGIEFDQDTRFGHMAWGIMLDWMPSVVEDSE